MYDYKLMGMSEEDVEKYSPHLDKLGDHGVSQDQLGAMLGVVLEIADMDTVDLGELKTGKSIETLVQEYGHYVENENFDREDRLGFIDKLISEAHDGDKATKAFEIYI